MFRFINPPGSALMIERKIENWHSESTRYWVDFGDISDNIKIAVIAAEDQHFDNHFGFDLAAIEQAILYNERGQAIRGASTISQQVAKNIFLWSSRSFIRKGFELWFTFWMEIFWSKERILEIYLNSAEWGEGIFGIEAAARYYFNTSATTLTLEQASLLAAVLPNPRYFSPVYPNERVQIRAKWIRQQVKNLGSHHYLKKLSTN